MTGQVSVLGWRIREVWLWGVGAALAGMFTPIPALTAMWWFYPVPLLGGLLLLAVLALVTRRTRDSTRPRTARLWAFLAWAILVGLLFLIITLVQFPPDRPVELDNQAIVLGLTVRLVGSGVLAAGLYELARRRVARLAASTPG